MYVCAVFRVCVCVCVCIGMVTFCARILAHPH